MLVIITFDIFVLAEIVVWVSICFCAAVGTLCLEIHSTTRALLSLREKEMHTICVDYYLLQLSPSNFRFALIDGWTMIFVCYLLVVLFTSFYYCLQEKQLIHNIRQYQVPLQKYIAMMELQAGFLTHHITVQHVCG